MRIVLAHRDLHAVTRGGIGTLYRALAPRLRAAGHEVILITQHSRRPLELDGIRVITLPRTGDLDRHRRAVSGTLESLAPDIADYVRSCGSRNSSPSTAASGRRPE
jgi:nucleoside-diphosphate-sugar epimerase